MLSCDKCTYWKKLQLFKKDTAPQEYARGDCTLNPKWERTNAFHYCSYWQKIDLS